ncbi:hypothetical protein C8R44DRAFT_871986 [Mycena epipterygia]|nr:hypothetical protein C8R44DRAFT_871986 [Mycena epipterygia]
MYGVSNDLLLLLPAIMLDPSKSHPYLSAVPWSSFRSNYDVLERMIPFLPLLSLIAFGQVDRLSHDIVKLRLSSRSRHYTRPFFVSPEDHATFFETLDRLQSWVVGSVPLAALSVLSDPAVPNNLNVITSGRALRIWIDIMREMEFDVQSIAPCTGIYGSVGHSFVSLSHPALPGRRITLTSSRSTSIFRLFFAAPNTHQMVAMSGRELITPYADMTSQQIATQGWAQQGWKQEQPTTPFINSLPKHSPFPGSVDLVRSTEHWYEPCGRACPGVLRAATGLDGIAHWEWNKAKAPEENPVPRYRVAENRLLRELGLSNVHWRTGGACRNFYCPNSDVFQAGQINPQTIPDVIMEPVLA